MLQATRDHEPIIANLLELYIHDFSEIIPVYLGPDGRFGYKGLSDYWTQPGHYPFLITVDDKLAGFALVKIVRAVTGEQEDWDMAEFFIVRAHRNHGIGLSAAHQVWQLFPGSWQVRVMSFNRPALLFWQRAIDAFVGLPTNPINIERDGKTWAVFTFESRT